MWLVFGFIFTFLLGRRPGFFALGSCGKPQRGRKATAPLHTPRAFFRSSWVVVCDTVLTLCFGIGCGTLCRGGCSGTVMRFSTCDARLRGYSCFRLPYFGSVLNCQYRSIQVQVSIFQLSTIAALYKKRPRGVQRGAALCPFAVFSHSNVIYPLRASTVYVPYSRSSAIYAVYTAGSPQSILCNNISYRNIKSSV